jgi:hypothetical protein
VVDALSGFSGANAVNTLNSLKMVNTDEGRYLLERINRLEDVGRNLERSIEVIKNSNVEQETRLVMLETNLSMLSDIRVQLDAMREALIKTSSEVLEIKTRLNVYIGVVCVIGSAIGSLIPLAIKAIPFLIALL